MTLITYWDVSQDGLSSILYRPIVCDIGTSNAET